MCYNVLKFALKSKKEFTTKNSSSTVDYLMENKPTMPFLTGTSHFIEELKKRTFKSGNDIVQFMNAETLTTEYLFEHGFSKPIVINSSEGLDLMVPPLLNWSDIEAYIGPETVVEVIDVEKQDPTMVEFSTFIRYMKKPKRHKVLNLISMECSEKSLGPMIEPPLVARELDWVAKYWPKEDEHARPKVQKYCLISPKNSYTDFHIDFGGTSVWYHILKGEKVFYIIRPTQANKSLFWNWNESSNRLYTFFADQVDECFKCTLKAGSTLFLPTGWIHAVLTTEDSLVYGGNFLHCLNIEEQLQIYSIERKLKTPPRYLFPHFEDLHWLAAHGLLLELDLLNKNNSPAPKYLLQGLKAILVFLKQWLPKPRMFFEMNEACELLKEISKQIRNADRLIQLLNPPKPERESTRTRRRPVYEDFIDFTNYKKKTPKKVADKNSASSSTEIANQNWHILNGGMKVVIKKLTDIPSTSSSIISTNNERRSDSPSTEFMRLLENDEDDDENSLKIVEYSSDLERISPQSSRHGYSPSHYSHSTDPASSKVTSRNQPLQSVPKDSISYLPVSGNLTSSHYGSIFSGESSGGAQMFKQHFRRKMSRMSSKIYMDDINITSNVVHQDDDYIYPSLEVSDDEDKVSHPVLRKDDEPWNPKARVGNVIPRTDRPSRIGKQKIAVEKGLEAAAANDHIPKLHKVLKRKKIVKPLKVATPVKPVKPNLLQNPAPVVPSTPGTANKPKKKGLATPKQRLGKILKLHKLRR